MNTMQENEQPVPSNGRKTRLLFVTAVLAVAGIGYGAYWKTVLSKYEQTEDAYAAGNVVQVTPQIAGTVLAVNGDDTEYIEAGKPLIALDKTDSKVAIEQAEAQLAQAVREVRVLFANNAGLQAMADARAVDVERAKADLSRRQGLANTGAISAEEIEHAKTSLKAAEAALTAAKDQLTSNKVMTDNTSVAQHPNVLRAAARLRELLVQESRTVIPAPVSGYIAKRAVQVGQRVAPGTPLLSVVPLNSLWVDANFKEGQITKMRIGQPVTLHADLYGDDITYHGKIAGMSAGTGSAFSLLPAQNATGNWIKVVQRIPVRIALDPKELEKNPLRVGLSMHVQVDISDQSGKSVAVTAADNKTTVYQTAVFDHSVVDADSRIQKIIREHSGAGKS